MTMSPGRPSGFSRGRSDSPTLAPARLATLAGLVLLVLGHRQSLLHYGYGAVFPTIVLIVAHSFGRGLEDEADTWKVFAVASFFIFGLTLRALTTGLGLP